jgi:hypothetical protein
MAEPIRRPHRRGVNRFVSAFLERRSRRRRGDVQDDDAAGSGIHLIDEAKAFVDVEAVIPVRGDDDHFVKFVVIVR